MRSGVLSWVGLYAWLATCVPVLAQPAARLVVDQWRVEDGLPQNTVTDIAQDDDGYLWVATRKGLARFDGAQFTAVDGVGDADIDNLRLTAVLPTSDGAVWVGTYGSGVLRVSKDAVTRYGSAEGVADSVIRDLSRDGEGRVWLSTARGARVFDGQRWQRPPLPDDLLDEGVNTVMQTRDGRLWFATSAHGVVSVKGTDVRRYSVAQGLSHPTVTSVAEGPDGTVWLAGPKGVATIQRGTITTISAAEGLAVDRVMQVIVDTRGVVWMTTHGGGLVRHDGAGFRTIRHSDGLSTDYLISLMEDRDGALWVGTLAGGLNRVAPAVRELLDRRSGLPPFPVTTVYQRRGSGTWWIGTYGGGLVRLRDGQLRVFTQADGLPSNAITSVAGGAGERVWVGTNGGGAFLFDDGRIVDRIGPDLVGDTLRTIERHGDVVWFGGNGLFRYAGGTLQRIGLAEGLRSTEVRVIYALPDRVWVGTYGGGLQSIGRDGRVMSWGEREGLTNPLVTSLHHDEVGTLWIGTYGGGLFRLKHGRITGVTSRDGLPDDVIFDVMLDHTKRLWLMGTQGLAFVPLADIEARLDGRHDVLSATRYGRADGVPGTDGTDGNQPLSWLANDGRLWFATVDGVVIFDPTEVTDIPHSPAAHVDAVQVNRQSVSLASLAAPLGGRNIDIAFSAPQVSGGRTVQYEYRLAGLHDDWMDAGTARSASFTNLSPGDYQFEVRARARPGAPPGTMGTVAFTIPARFYETPWFLAGAAALVGVALAGVMRWRLARLHARQAELQTLIDERTTALRHEMLERARGERERRLLDERVQQAQRLESLGVLAGGIAHDFNNLLVGVLGEASLALSDLPMASPGRQHVERIERAALRASELTSQMLAYSGGGRFIVQPVALDALVQDVRSLLEASGPRGITIAVEFTPDLPPVPGDPAQLRQVVLNLLTNAADAMRARGGTLHVAGGTCDVPAGAPETKPQGGAEGLAPGEYVWLEVRDEGDGMDAETLARAFDPFFTTKPGGRGLGLPATQGIVRSYGGRIAVTSQPASGTTVTLRLPTAPRPAERSIAVPAAGPPGPAGPIDTTGPWHVLVVDDERLVRDVARVALGRAGHTVTEVATGEDAVTAFTAAPETFSIVLLDLTLPGIQGRAVLQAMREVKPDLPIVVTSGFSAEEASDLTAGPCTVFLQKPWRPDQMISCVTVLLARTHQAVSCP
ncbi:MAG: response regulator [Acidobacteria bacterium]|nr:response regulator [Acidobacteriota bacterium]